MEPHPRAAANRVGQLETTPEVSSRTEGGRTAALFVLGADAVGGGYFPAFAFSQARTLIRAASNRRS